MLESFHLTNLRGYFFHHEQKLPSSSQVQVLEFSAIIDDFWYSKYESHWERRLRILLNS